MAQKTRMDELMVSVRRHDWRNNTVDEHVCWEEPDTDLIFYPEFVVPFGKDMKLRSKVPLYTLDETGLTADEIIEQAKKNMAMRAKCYFMSEVFTELFGGDDFVDYVPDIVVITTPDKSHGAGAIASTEILDQAKEMLGGGDIYIIPSSIHECLAVPADALDDINGLINIINEINGSLVAPHEQLSDHPYLWDGVHLRTVAA